MGQGEGKVKTFYVVWQLAELAYRYIGGWVGLLLGALFVSGLVYFVRLMVSYTFR